MEISKNEVLKEVQRELVFLDGVLRSCLHNHDGSRTQINVFRGNISYFKGRAEGKSDGFRSLGLLTSDEGRDARQQVDIIIEKIKLEWDVYQQAPSDRTIKRL